MIKLITSLAILTFIPLCWIAYGAVGYAGCWIFHGLHMFVFEIFNGVFIWPEQMAANFINHTTNISLPVWTYVSSPSMDDWSPPGGWVITLSVLTYLGLVGKAIQEYKDNPYS